VELILINLKEKDIVVDKTILYGLKSEGVGHIEVLDFKNNILDVGREVDYDYGLWLENLKVVNLRPNQSKIDTIDLDVFYVFKKGIYKIRYVDTRLENFSNWDTLKVN